MLNKAGDVEGRFDKMHRVPFGEFVPFKDWLPFMNRFSPYDYDYSITSGEKFTRFKLNQHHFGVLICYEDTDPFLARRYLEGNEKEPAIDFLVNVSNDGWFNGSCEHEEHLAISRFRAIECRRAMVRSVNMGISALIDGNGRVLKPSNYIDAYPPMWVIQPNESHVPDLPTSEWHHFKKVAGVLTVAVPIDHRFSFYTWAGEWLPIASDWLPLGCWLALFVAGWMHFSHRRVAT
jgi:apolipoprotein N-acyltransferase